MLAVVVVAHLLVMVDAMGTNELGFARTGLHANPIPAPTCPAACDNICWRSPLCVTHCDKATLIQGRYLLTGPLEPLLYPSSVSIVVPCYNCAEFVLLAFESFERSFDMLQSLVHRLGTRYVPCARPLVAPTSLEHHSHIICCCGKRT